MTPIAKRNRNINAVLQDLLSDSAMDRGVVDEIYKEYGGQVQWWRCYNIAKSRRMVSIDWIIPEEFDV